MAIDYARHEHHEFLAASAAAMADADLQGALTQLGDTLAARNREAFAALAESSQLRDRARAIKDAALANLAEHIETLETSVIRNGGQVHFADDAEAATRIVLDLLEARGARRVVKSKSMTNEEIHLNAALAERQIEVIETDFGEYIIQVAGHRPSHLVAPAIHLRTPQVADLLSRDAGQQLPADAEQLAAYARRRLRAEFARADAGITGGNFAIAETGTIVLVSNEGNIRLTTTLPRLQIAVVGIEKIIPRLADLPVFLKVLARAATGQKLSIYTSLVSGPRRPGELDGPEEFHLVLLDNGRSRILASPLRESLFCIRCGACLNACPIFRNVGGHAYGGVYSGPIGAVLTPLYDGLAANHHLPHASSLCGACQAACPVKIAIPEMLIQLRDRLHAEPGQLGRGESLAYLVWSHVMRRPGLYRLATWLATRTARLVPRARSGWLTRLPGPLAGWTRDRDFPSPARRRFRDWWEDDVAPKGRNNPARGNAPGNGTITTMD
ncbi:MAG TPA: LutB/LldF family L-lactate oxidation iron-sulfur protein [Pirellulales bacterium]|jgi:L-lactate dehydrogenase complex protein LldF|nr:LutB/LldF family L-lactate oxidation iron-sulfur protein [Pirellulales bacterium]